MTNHIVLVNNFSLNMLKDEDIPFVKFNRVFIDEIIDDMSWCTLESKVLSEELASYLSHVLNVKLGCSSKYLKMDGSFRLIIANVSGGQIPPGARSLPKGVRLKFHEVIIDHIPVVPLQGFEAMALTGWPIEHLEKEGPTMIRINWDNGEATHIQIAPGMDGEWAAYVHSRSGRIGDFIAACGQQTWQDVIKKEEAA